jgi:DNA-directed RNA polymerase specialized sigma24 family protein
VSYRDQARRALESSAARSTQNNYLKQIRARHRALERLEDVEDLLDILRNPGADAGAKDALLLALLDEYQRAQGGPAFALLAAAMFPALDHVYRARLRRGGEADDLWGRVVGAFAEALDRYPIHRRPARVAANIEGDTMASLRRASQREVRSSIARDAFCEATAPYLDEIQAVDSEVPRADRLGLGDFVEPGSEKPAKPDPEELEAARAAIAPLFDASGTSPEDRFLILGVHLYDRTLGDLAAEIGISREAAKKRHLRALTPLRRTRTRIGGRLSKR